MRLAFALYGQVAGIVERGSGRTTLEYLLECRASHSPTPLSLSMPVRLRRIRQDDAAWQNDEDQERWSLAGVQAKFTLAHGFDGWALATGAAPSMHIVKPGISKIRAQALSEHVSMRALAIAGFDVAETQYLTFEDQGAIVVTRFDQRRAASGATIRIHQEDLIQDFGMDPTRKYDLSWVTCADAGGLERGDLR